MDMKDRLVELIDQKQEYGIATESKPEEWLIYENNDLVDHLITNGVQIVRHGKWLLEREPDGNPYCFHCSVCDNDFHYIGITTAYRYCPHCGAKMDLEEEK